MPGELSALETKLGATMLERTTRSVRLAAAGRACCERAAALISLSREAESAVAETSAPITVRST